MKFNWYILIKKEKEIQKLVINWSEVLLRNIQDTDINKTKIEKSKFYINNENVLDDDYIS